MTKSAHHTRHPSQDDAGHWNRVYATSAPKAVSWHEPEPSALLAALALAGLVAEFDEDFTPHDVWRDRHSTPGGAVQPFTWLSRVGGDRSEERASGLGRANRLLYGH